MATLSPPPSAPDVPRPRDRTPPPGMEAALIATGFPGWYDDVDQPLAEHYFDGRVWLASRWKGFPQITPAPGARRFLPEIDAAEAVPALLPGDEPSEVAQDVIDLRGRLDLQHLDGAAPDQPVEPQERIEPAGDAQPSDLEAALCGAVASWLRVTEPASAEPCRAPTEIVDVTTPGPERPAVATAPLESAPLESAPLESAYLEAAQPTVIDPSVLDRIAGPEVHDRSAGAPTERPAWRRHVAVAAACVAGVGFLAVLSGEVVLLLG